MSYFDVSICAVPDDRRADYDRHCRDFHVVAKELGALSVVDAWGDSVPDGVLTDFRKAVKAEPGETVAVGWIVWPDKTSRDKAWDKMMADPRMQNMQMPFDGKRMIFGSFAPVLES